MIWLEVWHIERGRSLITSCFVDLQYLLLSPQIDKHKVASTNMPCLEPNPSIYRLLMKGKIGPLFTMNFQGNVLMPLG